MTGLRVIRGIDAAASLKPREQAGGIDPRHDVIRGIDAAASLKRALMRSSLPAFGEGRVGDAGTI